MQIDDYVFGVAAIDAAGHESFVTAYVAPAARQHRHPDWTVGLVDVSLSSTSYNSLRPRFQLRPSGP